MDVGSFAIGILAGGAFFGFIGMLIGIVVGSMASRIDHERSLGSKLKPMRDGSVKFN